MPESALPCHDLGIVAADLPGALVEMSIGLAHVGIEQPERNKAGSGPNEVGDRVEGQRAPTRAPKPQVPGGFMGSPQQPRSPAMVGWS
jgi:hypothetical protein